MWRYTFLDEVQNVLLTNAVNVVPIPTVASCSLKAVLKPTVRDPPRNLVVVFPQAQLQFAHRVTVPNASGCPDSLQLCGVGIYAVLKRRRW
jgi:hypothetical protein